MFEQLGYYKDYYIGNKYVGKIECEKDREDVGYTSRKIEVLQESIRLSNKKIIKAGQEVVTMLYPLSGKLIKP
jgi:hypothetical protein